MRNSWLGKALAGRTLLVAALSVAACEEHPDVWRPAPDAQGPIVLVSDSVVLSEPDSTPLGAYTSFFGRSGTGKILVADGTKLAVFRFSPSGKFESFLGRAGEGPGEFGLPSSIVVLPGDSIVGVYDINKRALSLFTLATNTFRGEVKFPSQDVGASWGFRGDTMIVPLHMGRQLIGNWRLGDSAAVGAGRLQEDMEANPALMIRHGRPGLALTEFGIALFQPTQPGLLLVDDAGSTKGMVAIPAARRLGEPANLKTLTGSGAGPEAPTKVRASSADGIHRLPNGDLVVAHLDMEAERVGQSSIRFGHFQLFLSVIRADLASACVDGLVPVATDVPPMPVFQGDTVFVLARRVDEDGRVNSTVYAVRLDLSNCQWIPTGGVVASSAAQN